MFAYGYLLNAADDTWPTIYCILGYFHGWKACKVIRNNFHGSKFYGNSCRSGNETCGKADDIIIV